MVQVSEPGEPQEPGESRVEPGVEPRV